MSSPSKSSSRAGAAGPPVAGPSRAGAAGLVIAGLLIGLGGILHPRVDTAVEFEQGLAGMFESSIWTASHSLTMAGYLTLAVSLALLVRGVGAGWSRHVRVLCWIAAGGAAFAAVESLPHLLAASEAADLRRGAEAPLADLHTTLQGFATPVLGLSLAALVLAGVRSHTLDAGWIVTALAVVGGVAYALAGPAIAISENSGLSPLFVGSAGLAVWAVVAGVRLVRRGVVAAPPADRSRELAPAR